MQRNERLVPLVIESDVPQHCPRDVLSYSCSLLLRSAAAEDEEFSPSDLLVDINGLKFPIGRRDEFVCGGLDLAQKDLEHEGDALEAEHVISGLLA